MTQAHRVFFVSTEPSGDQLAAETLLALRENNNDTQFEFGIIGGQKLQDTAQTHSAIETEGLAIHGYWDALMAYPRVQRLAASAADSILAFKPETVVLVDAWGFSMMLAKALKGRQADLHITKLVGPQIWATRPGRAKKLAKYVDHILCLLDLEPPYYAPHNVKTTVIGLPALTRAQKGKGKKVRKVHGLEKDEKVLLVLPGSRPSEIKRVAPDLMAAAKRVKAANPETIVLIAPATNVREQFLDHCAGGAIPSDFDHIILDESVSTYDAMDITTYAMACSGTVTTELAIKSIPMLVAYKADIVAYVLAKYLLFKPNYVTILNILEDQDIVPEFLQYEQDPTEMAKEAIAVMSSPTKLLTQINAQNKAVPRLGSTKTPASEIAAEAIHSTLSQSRHT